MHAKIDMGWQAQLKDEFEKDYYLKLSEFVREEYKTQDIYPSEKLIFNAFDVKIVGKSKEHLPRPVDPSPIPEFLQKVRFPPARPSRARGRLRGR